MYLYEVMLKKPRIIKGLYTACRQSILSQYPSIFNSYFSSCSNFKHEVRDCRMYNTVNDQEHYQNQRRNLAISKDRFQNNYVSKNYMAFSSSFRSKIEFLNFHHDGNIAHDWRHMMESSRKNNSNIRYKKVWRRKK